MAETEAEIRVEIEKERRKSIFIGKGNEGRWFDLKFISILYDS